MRPCWQPGSSPLRKQSVPPAGLETAVNASTSGRCRRRWATGVSDSRAGRSRTCLIPLIRRSPRRSASARAPAVPPAGFEPAAFSASGRRSYHQGFTGKNQRPWWESNPRHAILQIAASPLDHRIRQSARRESNPPRIGWKTIASPLGHGHVQRKERESNPQGSSLVPFRAGCSRPSACPSVAPSALAFLYGDGERL